MQGGQTLTFNACMQPRLSPMNGHESAWYCYNNEFMGRGTGPGGMSWLDGMSGPVDVKKDVIFLVQV